MEENKPENISTQKPKKRIFPKIFLGIVIIILVLIAVLFVRAYSIGSKVFVNHQSFYKNVTSLLGANTSQIQGEAEGQINILLLGYGGQGHDGPYLTDSMILASINPATKQVLLTSIPRDLYYASGSGNKINAAFANGYAESNDFNVAGEQAREAVEKLSGETIPYFASMDFQGFVEAIDRVGGVDINVERTFTDYSYPNDATNGYLPPQKFVAGPQHMDGARALIFARSRHAAGVEGSDFARSKRQQLVIEAFEKKALQLNLSSAQTISDLLNIFADHFQTNLQLSDIVHLATILNGNPQIISQSIDQDSGLVCPQILQPSGEYVLNLCDGVTDSQIQSYFQNGLIDAPLRDENASITIEDSGSDTPLFNQIKTNLLNANLTVKVVAYKGIPLSQSVLYALNPKPATESYIKNTFQIPTSPAPNELNATTDLVLIVGGSSNGSN